jgi:hypothetical protein
MTTTILFICIAVGSILLAAGFFLRTMVVLSVVSILLGGVWCFAAYRRWTWICSLIWVVIISGCVLGSILKLSPLLLLTCVLFSLGAWDLSQFTRRLEGVKGLGSSDDLEKRHLYHLALIGGVGFVLGAIPLFVQISLSFIWATVIVVLVLFALNRVLAYLGDRGG